MTDTARIGIAGSVRGLVERRDDVTFDVLPSGVAGGVRRWDGPLLASLREIHAAILDSASCARETELFSYLIGREIPLLVIGAAGAPPADSPAVETGADEKDVAAFVNRVVGAYENRRRAADDERRVADNGFSPNGIGLVNAAALNHTDVIAALIRLGVPVDSTDGRGVPAIHAAVRALAWDAVELLLDSGADIDAVAEDRGATLVAELAAARRHELLRRCLAAGARLDRPNHAGQTALMIAVGAKDTESALLLLEYGADATIPDALGMTAASYAKLFGLTEVVDRIS